MNGLRSEWMVVVSTMKAEEQFKNYLLAKLVGILKSHERKVTKETKVVLGMGSLALVAKGKQADEDDADSNLSDYELTSEEYALMVSKPRRFAKKKFPSKNRT